MLFPNIGKCKDVLVGEFRQNKEIKVIQIKKSEIKLPLLTKNMIIYLEFS